MRMHALAVTLAALSISMSMNAAPLPDASAKQAQLKQLFADEWEYELRDSPELATSIGDYRYNDRWSDASLAHVQEQKRDLQQWLTKLEAFDPAGLNEQEQLSLQLRI